MTRSFAIVTVLLLFALRVAAARDNYAGDDACRSCHATQVNSFREKCHGPGREHVKREQAKATPVSDTAILNPAHFTRDGQMDLCAWCHAGHGQAILPAFSYLANNPLDKYINFPKPDANAALDQLHRLPHAQAGNQPHCV